MNKKSVFIISLLLFVSVTAAQTNETAQAKYSPGLIDSGSPLYGLELAADNAAVSVGIKKASSVAQERVAEVESASERNDTQGMERAAQAFENVAKRASAEEAEEISEAESSLESAIQNAPEQAQQGLSTALENVRKDRMNKTRMADQNRQENSQTPEPDRDIRDSIENRSTDTDSPQDSTNTSLDEPTTREGEETSDSDSSTTRRSSSTGRFDLMISDRPADISKFDFVNVSFSEARIFMETQEKETNETSGNQTINETTTNETVNETDNSTEESENQGHTVVQLNNSSVDLTTVVGDKAESIADIELDKGNYTKIELYSSNIDAEVNGSSVDVKIPPKKLMINKPFEVSANETTQFVFDIQVVLRGNERNNQGYILKPVISESGVAGKDVNVTENDMSEMDEEEQERNETEQGGPPANPGSQAQRP